MVVDTIRDGGVVLYPTDTGFSLGCALANKEAIHRIRSIRRLPEQKEMTFLCRSLSNIAEFARVSNSAYRTIKHLIPGPYTFILPAGKLTPRYAQSEKRKTAGIRVPEHNLSQLLLESLASPIISISAKSEENYFPDPDEIIDELASQVALTVRSDEYNFLGESTIIDMTTDNFEVIRDGVGAEKAYDYISGA